MTKKQKKKPEKEEGVKSAYLEHRSFWNKCENCEFHQTARVKVFFRGDLPCRVLFIGEAPGPTEDDVGEPFVGRAGKLLDKWVERLQTRMGKFTWGVTNIVACYPGRNPDNTFVTPVKHNAEACEERLLEMIEIADPEAVILLGTTAEKFGPTSDSLPVRTLPHPSYILRSGGLDAMVGKRAFLRSVVMFEEILRK